MPASTAARRTNRLEKKKKTHVVLLFVLGQYLADRDEEAVSAILHLKRLFSTPPSK
jgi:hypothetical protein